MIRVDARQLQEALRRLVPSVNAELAERLPAEAEALLQKANETVPVKTGALRDSGFYDLMSRDGEVLKAVIGYRATYAARVHETASEEHGGKWFEKAFDAFESEFQGRAMALVQAALDRATR